MRILLTGATGFLGRRLGHALGLRGDAVHGICRAMSNRSGCWAGMHWHDIGVPTDTIFTTAKPDVVIHAATEYGRAGATDADVERANLVWPQVLLHAAASHGVQRFVNIDTSLPSGISAYARTKRAFAAAARAAATQGGARVLNVRLESVYGPGDDRAKFQMALFETVRGAAESIALTPGEQTRDFIYVDDAVEAILLLIDHAAAARDPYIEAGVGRGEEVSIRQFAEQMLKAMSDAGLSARTRLNFGALAYREGELMRACADISLLRALGWRGGRSLSQGLNTLVHGEADGA